MQSKKRRWPHRSHLIRPVHRTKAKRWWLSHLSDLIRHDGPQASNQGKREEGMSDDDDEFSEFDDVDEAPVFHVQCSSSRSPGTFSHAQRASLTRNIGAECDEASRAAAQGLGFISLPPWRQWPTS